MLLQQHHSGSVVTTDGGSVASSITGVTTPQRPGARNSVTLHKDVVVLTGTSSLPPIPVAIQSPMAHITLATGTANKEKDCPNLRCIFDTWAALSTANFHFMESVIHQFPHILKQIYMPTEYAAIVLSGIVTSSNDEPITMQSIFYASRSPSTSSVHRSLSLSSRPLMLHATFVTLGVLPISLLLFRICVHAPMILRRRATQSPVRKHDLHSQIAGFLPCHLTPLRQRMPMIIIIRSWGTLGICKCHH